jgi:hypothetical protein
MNQTDLLQGNYFPIQFKFKISTLHNDFVATDALGNTHAYVKQKLFKLKEHIKVFADTSQTELKYEIKASKWLDFNTSYSFIRPDGSTLVYRADRSVHCLWLGATSVV